MRGRDSMSNSGAPCLWLCCPLLEAGPHASARPRHTPSAHPRRRPSDPRGFSQGCPQARHPRHQTLDRPSTDPRHTLDRPSTPSTPGLRYRCPFARRIDQRLASGLELLGAGCRASRAAKPRVERWRERAAAAIADSPLERRVQRPPRACSGVGCVSVYESLIRMASPAGRGSLCVGSNRRLGL